MGDQAVTIDLSAPVQLADVPRLARAFLSWWGRELVAAMPPQVKALLPKPRQPALLFARAGTWRIVAGSDDAQSIELNAEGNDSAVAEQILRLAPDFALSRLTVVLPREGVLVRRIELPLVPEARVREAVELQIDRYSPFTADAVRLATRVAARDIIGGKLEAEVVFAPKAGIEQLEARLLALGLKPAAVDIEGANGGPAGFDLRAIQSQTGNRRSLLIHAGLAAAAALTWWLAFYAWGAARDGEIESWQQRVAELKPVAERTASLRRQVEGMAQPFEIARAHMPARSLSILTELTNVLPDDARLIEFRLAGDLIELTGVGANAPALISKIEASKLFAGVKFKAPVTRWQGTAQDRFEITAKLEGARKR